MAWFFVVWGGPGMYDQRIVLSSFIFVMTGGCSHFVCASVLPRRDTDAAHGWLVGSTGRWKSFTQVVSFVRYDQITCTKRACSSNL